MPKGDVPADVTFLVCLWLEAIVYGFFFCLFCASLYVNITLRRRQDAHSRVMFLASIVFFVIATLHVAMNCYRMVMAYVIRRNAPGGPVAYIGQLAPWDHVFKDTLYCTQEILGDAVAVYRTYVVWGHNWKAVVLPGALLIVSLISGYSVCGLYPTEDPNSTVFDPRLMNWITTFYAVTVVQGGLTTGLMGYRIWQADRKTASIRTGRSNLMPILRILIESASIQFMAEVILLSLYSANYNAQYLVLESVTPLVGITFNAITIRIALFQSENWKGSASEPRHELSSGGHGRSVNQVATIGSMPLRSIKVNVQQDIEMDDQSVFSQKRQGATNRSDETFGA